MWVTEIKFVCKKIDHNIQLNINWQVWLILLTIVVFIQFLIYVIINVHCTKYCTTIIPNWLTVLGIFENAYIFQCSTGIIIFLLITTIQFVSIWESHKHISLYSEVKSYTVAILHRSESWLIILISTEYL